MAKILFLLVAGLDQSLLKGTPNLQALRQFSSQLPLHPINPAVTCSMQATLTTGVTPARHGIIANGLYTHDRPALHPNLDLTSFPDYRRETSFWEQSNALLQAPRFWHNSGKKVALLFFQNSMAGAADIVLTPKPTHSPDGKTLTACWSAPSDLYAQLSAKLGPFPLMQYWGPMASLPSSQWILRAAEEVWREHRPDIQLVYIPHLDYNLQRKGPTDPSVIKDLQDVDAALLPLLDLARRDHAHIIIAGDYAMTSVHTPILPNLAFRQAGLLHTKPDETGKLLVDYARTSTFAMADHQIAHIYCSPSDPEHLAQVRQILQQLPGIDRILAGPELDALGLANPRSGNLVALSKPDAWFAHDWWLSDAEKPAWQFSVDIHRKPGYDPRELFFDPAHKCIAQDPSVVKGSHGLVSPDPAQWPVLICDQSIAPATPHVDATAIAPWLAQLAGITRRA